MKKYRLLSILCMAMAVVCLLLLADPTEVAAATEVASGTCGDNLTWTLDDEGTLTISGTGKMYNRSYWKWYDYRDNIKKVIVEEGVESIGSYAFSKCANIVEPINFPSSLTSIGVEAFYECTGMKGTLIIPEGVTSIGASAFSGCSGLTGDLLIPDNVEQIGNSTFARCTGLTGTLTLPENLKTIGGWAFNNCSGLTGALTLPEGLESIGEQAFGGCAGFSEELVIPRSVTNIKLLAFKNCSGITGLSIEGGNLTIGNDVFNNCIGMQTVSINGNINKIGSYAFYGCEGLSSVNVSRVEDWCNIDIAHKTGSPLYMAKTLYINGEPLTGKLIIPDGVTTISTYAFYNCSYLTEVYIPDSVTYIGEAAFSGCSSLKHITIPFVGDSIKSGSDSKKIAFGFIFGTEEYEGSVLTEQLVSSGIFDTSQQFYLPETLTSVAVLGGDIPSGAFYACNTITSIELPEKIYSIGEVAFGNCTGLTSIVIPDGTVDIGAGAFAKCTQLSAIDMPESVYKVGASAFLDTAWLKNETSKTSYGVIYIGKVAYSQVGKPGNVTLREGTLGVADRAFYGCSNLSTITIPASLKYFGEEAFYNCKSVNKVKISDLAAWCEIESQGLGNPVYYAKALYLNDIKLSGNLIIPDGVQRIGEDAFYGCKGITSISIPNSVKEIKYGAFEACDDLAVVHVADLSSWCKIDFSRETANPLNNGGNLYIGNNHIRQLIIPEDITEIKPYAFYGYQALESVVVGESVVGIGESAFSCCSNLKSVVIKEGTTKLGFGAFSCCEDLVSVTMPNSVITLDAAVFFKCSKLKTIVIPETVTSIGQECFKGCSNLNSVIIPNNVTSVGSYAFEDCVSLEYARIGKNVRTISEYLFHNCSSLKTVDFMYEADQAVQIGRRAFQGCSALTDIEFAFYVYSFGTEAFAECTTLKEITFKEYAPSISQTAFASVQATAYYPAQDESWTTSILQNYGGTITWLPYDTLVKVGQKNYVSFSEALSACQPGQSIVLKSHILSEDVLTKDLYIDLNGFDLTGTVVTNGYKIYGMDSTTDSYSCEAIGYMNLVDENGNEIVPEAHFMSDITGSSKRYMAIKDENGYSFHRFFLGVTHMSVKPSSTGVGYKAVFYGDDMVAAALNSFGFTMQLEGNDPITVKMSGDKFVSGKVITLRIDNYDVEHFGETGLSAKVMLQLTDGTVIESGAATMTFRGLMEQLNTNHTALTQAQLTAVAEMIEKYVIIKQWNIENLYTA